MKQIIVNVADLTIEEKHRVNEALAKIKSIRMCSPPRWERVITMYGPSFDGISVGFDYHNRANPTHTPQQVFEMAGSVPSANQHVFLADTLIITDSSGSIIYDSTLKEEKKGHIHAELMQQYAEDAKTSKSPWELWQASPSTGVWHNLNDHPKWWIRQNYRRKPKTHFVRGAEIPDLRVTPELGGKYYLADPTSSELVELHTYVMRREELWFERGLSYQHSEEGRQAAILHSKAMLGIV